jgi:hypothetical protein
MVKSTEFLVVESVDGNEEEAGKLKGVDVDRIRFDDRLGWQLKIFAEAFPVDRSNPCCVDKLEVKECGSDGGLSLRLSGNLPRRSTLECVERGFGPDVLDDVSILLSIEPFRLVVFEPLRKTPVPAQREGGSIQPLQ